MGYATYEVTTAAGKAASIAARCSGQCIRGNPRFSVSMNPDGTVRSIRDKAVNRELVNAKGERPFNDLLRVEGPDASKVSYPVAAESSVKAGSADVGDHRLSRPFVIPAHTISIYEGFDRVELRNELDPTKMPFVGGNNNWHDSYYFAFPFNVSKDGLKVMRGNQRYFDRLPG